MMKYLIVVWNHPLWNATRTEIQYPGRWHTIATSEDDFFAGLIATALTKGPVATFEHVKIVQVDGRLRVEKQHYYYPDRETAEREQNNPV